MRPPAGPQKLGTPEQPLLALGYWGAKRLGSPAEGDFVSIESLVLALRGAFCAREARGPRRLYRLQIDGASLQVEVKGRQVTAPSDSTDEPDVTINTSREAFAQLFAGSLDIDDASATGELRIAGDETEARRFFAMFRIPS
jgi:putative sterol carrier protein